MTWIGIIAVMLSPLIAVLISDRLEKMREKRRDKVQLFSTLMATRHLPFNFEAVRAQNMIDTVFYNCPDVTRLWREYFEMLSNQGLNNELGWKQRNKKNLEMLQKMGAVLGYGNALSHLDIDRVYYPEGIANQIVRSELIANELLRVLQASAG